MNKDLDEKFFERADAHINVSNEQLKDITPGKVSASMMYATSRFDAWWMACGFSFASDMAARRDENVDYFMQEYLLMLEENMDDYIKNFDKYMAVGKDS